MCSFKFFTEKLVLESRKSDDYAFTQKGCENADGINDIEEWKGTQVTDIYMFTKFINPNFIDCINTCSSKVFLK